MFLPWRDEWGNGKRVGVDQVDIRTIGIEQAKRVNVDHTA
jgi:hypothetical protein